MTTPGGPLDTVFIEILPDFDKFTQKLLVGIRAQMKLLEAEVKRLADSMERDLERAATISGRALADKISNGAAAAENAIQDIGTQSDITARRVRRAARDMERSFLTVVGGALDNLTKGALSAGGALLSALTSIGPGIPLVIAGLVALAGALIAVGALASKLVGILGAFPGVVLTLAAAIAPLVIGFQGFGDAISAILEKDPEKIKKALDALSPSARAVAREFQALTGQFGELRKIVQESLFAPLVGDLKRVGEALAGPLTTGLSSVANILGLIISDFADLAASPENINLINETFATTARILENLRPSLAAIESAFIKVGTASLPLTEILASKFADLLTKFADWLTRVSEDGSLEEFFNQAILVGGVFLDLFESIGSVIGALFSDENAGKGAEFIQGITKGLNDLAAFLKTPEGMKFLENLIEFAKIALAVVVGLTIGIAFLIASLVEFFKFVGSAIDLSIAEFEFFRDIVLGVAAAIVSAFTSIPAKLEALAGFFGNAGRTLIEAFVGGFRRAGNFIADVAGDIVGHIKGGLNFLIGKINAGIGILDLAFPGTLPRLSMLAAGGLARGPAIIGEAGSELALPLNDSRAQAAIRQAIGDVGGGGTTINFGPGAVVAQFEGVVPTRAEALSVGEALGEGIASLLAKRNIRMQVRAI